MKEKNSMKRIVITGGHCGGKTTIINRVREYFDPAEVRVVDEVATQLLPLFPLPGRDTKLSPEWLRHFQGAVKAAQEASLAAWSQSSAKVIVFDRGLADGPGYLGDQAEFCRLFNCRMSDLWAPYDKVVFLQSLATTNPTLYLELKATNACRYESLEEAKRVDEQLLAAWRNCSGTWLCPIGELEEKTQLVLDLVEQNLRGEKI